MALLTSACSGGSGGGANESRPDNELHIAVYGDAAASAEQAAADRFNETSDVKVVVDSLPGDDTYPTAVRTSLGTANAPDIFMSWGAADIQQLVDAGAILPLDDFIAQVPELKSSFLPSVFDGEVIDGVSYGIPMRGVAPTFLFYNKSVLADAGLEPAASWDDLVSQSATLADSGVIPVALAGADKWPTQMWFQYAFARQIGNEQVAKGLAGDAEVWASDGSKKALDDLSGLIGDGAFGATFDSVGYSNQGTTALLSQGKAAYELMGTWNYATLAAADPTFAAEDLGWIAFPSLDGGEGKAGEIAGNLSNYYNVAADTRYPEVARDFLKELYSDDFVKDELALGNLPPTVSAGDFIAADTTIDAQKKEYLTFVFDLVQNAPSFQLSWDQTVPTASKTGLQDAVAGYFNGSLDSAAWITQMQALTAPAGQ
ncbi:extracellular solute-binding protein [Herbiconiux sp. CPCC 205716]|uniref:Extracellular solute-binding protein n=1 Tax=Herbiconiux gentiana TaxID=2970912 RepID=A0ABT2GAG4_9MICO|nr:extracellular solute-binding protein [Herbiconiux gentiana]MCS5713138.1 extracellular solute-binding protein [Herbiconiux gentiana]